MKVLIVFIALAILNTLFLTYQTDMNRYIRENTYIKSTAEECAAGASLFYDEEALSEGYYVFNKEECEKYIEFILEHSFSKDEDLDYEVVYYDNVGTEDPAIEVIITVRGRDRFRLSFLKKDLIKRSGYYEIVGY